MCSEINNEEARRRQEAQQEAQRKKEEAERKRKEAEAKAKQAEQEAKAKQAEAKAKAEAEQQAKQLQEVNGKQEQAQLDNEGDATLQGDLEDYYLEVVDEEEDEDYGELTVTNGHNKLIPLPNGKQPNTLTFGAGGENEVTFDLQGPPFPNNREVVDNYESTPEMLKTVYMLLPAEPSPEQAAEVREMEEALYGHPNTPTHIKEELLEDNPEFSELEPSILQDFESEHGFGPGTLAEEDGTPTRAGQAVNGAGGVEEAQAQGLIDEEGQITKKGKDFNTVMEEQGLQDNPELALAMASQMTDYESGGFTALDLRNSGVHGSETATGFAFDEAEANFLIDHFGDKTSNTLSPAGLNSLSELGIIESNGMGTGGHQLTPLGEQLMNNPANVELLPDGSTPLYNVDPASGEVSPNYDPEDPNTQTFLDAVASGSSPEEAAAAAGVEWDQAQGQWVSSDQGAVNESMPNSAEAQADQDAQPEQETKAFGTPADAVASNAPEGGSGEYVGSGSLQSNSGMSEEEAGWLVSQDPTGNGQENDALNEAEFAALEAQGTIEIDAEGKVSLTEQGKAEFAVSTHDGTGGNPNENGKLGPGDLEATSGIDRAGYDFLTGQVGSEDGLDAAELTQLQEEGVIEIDEDGTIMMTPQGLADKGAGDLLNSAHNAGEQETIAAPGLERAGLEADQAESLFEHYGDAETMESGQAALNQDQLSQAIEDGVIKVDAEGNITEFNQDALDSAQHAADVQQGPIDQLTQLHADGELDAALAEIYPEPVTQEQRDAVSADIAASIESGDWSWLPTPDVIDSDTLNSGNTSGDVDDVIKGAFAADGNRIFINGDFPLEDQQAAYGEELGHFFDTLLRGDVDTVGDEGELFGLALAGDLFEKGTTNLTPAAMTARTSAADNKGQITVDGETLEVEFNGGTSNEGYPFDYNNFPDAIPQLMAVGLDPAAFNALPSKIQVEVDLLVTVPAYGGLNAFSVLSNIQPPAYEINGEIWAPNDLGDPDNGSYGVYESVELPSLDGGTITYELPPADVQRLLFSGITPEEFNSYDNAIRDEMGLRINTGQHTFGEPFVIDGVTYPSTPPQSSAIDTQSSLDDQQMSTPKDADAAAILSAIEADPTLELDEASLISVATSLGVDPDVSGDGQVTQTDLDIVNGMLAGETYQEAKFFSLALSNASMSDGELIDSLIIAETLAADPNTSVDDLAILSSWLMDLEAPTTDLSGYVQDVKQYALQSIAQHANTGETELMSLASWVRDAEGAVWTDPNDPLRVVVGAAVAENQNANAATTALIQDWVFDDTNWGYELDGPLRAAVARGIASNPSLSSDDRQAIEDYVRNGVMGEDGGLSAFSPAADLELQLAMAQGLISNPSTDAATLESVTQWFDNVREEDVPILAGEAIESALAEQAPELLDLIGDLSFELIDDGNGGFSLDVTVDTLGVLSQEQYQQLDSVVAFALLSESSTQGLNSYGFKGEVTIGVDFAPSALESIDSYELFQNLVNFIQENPDIVDYINSLVDNGTLTLTDNGIADGADQLHRMLPWSDQTEIININSATTRYANGTCEGWVVTALNLIVEGNVDEAWGMTAGRAEVMQDVLTSLFRLEGDSGYVQWRNNALGWTPKAEEGFDTLLRIVPETKGFFTNKIGALASRENPGDVIVFNFFTASGAKHVVGAAYDHASGKYIYMDPNFGAIKTPHLSEIEYMFEKSYTAGRNRAAVREPFVRIKAEKFTINPAQSRNITEDILVTFRDMYSDAVNESAAANAGTTNAGVGSGPGGAQVAPIETPDWAAHDDPVVMRNAFLEELQSNPMETLSWLKQAPAELKQQLVGEGGSATVAPLTHTLEQGLQSGDLEQIRYSVNAASLLNGDITTFKYFGNPVVLKNGAPMLKVGSLEIGISSFGKDSLGLKLFGERWDFEVKVPYSGDSVLGKVLEGFPTVESTANLLGAFGLFLSAAVGVNQLMEGDYVGAAENIGGVVGGTAGAYAGAAFGAAVGGPVGAVLGGFIGGMIGGAGGSHLAGGVVAHEWATETFNPLGAPDLNSFLLTAQTAAYAQVLEDNANLIFGSDGTASHDELEAMRTYLQDRSDNGTITDEEVLLLNAVSFFAPNDSSYDVSLWDHIKHPEKTHPNNIFSALDAGATGVIDEKFTLNDVQAVSGYAKAHFLYPQEPSPDQYIDGINTVMEFIDGSDQYDFPIEQSAMALIVSDDSIDEDIRNAFALSLWHVRDPYNPDGPVTRDIFTTQLSHAETLSLQYEVASSLGGNPIYSTGTTGTDRTTGSSGTAYPGGVGERGQSYNPETGAYSDLDLPPGLNSGTHHHYFPVTVMNDGVETTVYVEWYDNPAIPGGQNQGVVPGGIGGAGGGTTLTPNSPYGRPGYTILPDYGVAFRILPPGEYPHHFNQNDPVIHSDLLGAFGGGVPII